MRGKIMRSFYDFARHDFATVLIGASHTHCILGWIAGGAGGRLRDADDNLIITSNLFALTAVVGAA
jgi:hypothetical protein